jgi:kynurenine formamidase
VPERRFIDLTLPLDAGTQVYPGDPRVVIEPDQTVAQGGFNVHRFTLGTHTGTHLDAPYHIDDGGTRVDAIDLGLLAGPAVIADARHRGDRCVITVNDLSPCLDALGAGVVLLVRTGWTAHHGTPRYLDHPYLDAEACRAVLDRGVRTLGVDAMSLDETADGDHPGAGWPCHHLVLGVGGVLIENLTNLDRIDFPDPFVTAFPLRLTGLDGSPVRAVAMDRPPG